MVLVVYVCLGGGGGGGGGVIITNSYHKCNQWLLALIVLLVNEIS